MDNAEDEFWTLTRHAVQRWKQRVSDGDPHVEIEEFLLEASLRRRPPKWVGKSLLMRKRRPKPRNGPVSFALSPAWPGVCLVVDRQSRRVITALSREDEST